MILKVFAAALIVGTTGKPALAFGFKNCTDLEIRVEILDPDDGGETMAGSRTLAAKASMWIQADDKPYLVTVMRRRGSGEVPALIRNGLDGNGDFTIHASGAFWSFRSGDDCMTSVRLPSDDPSSASGTAGDGQPLATIMLDTGIWVSDSAKALRLRNFTGHSVEIRHQGGDLWSTYTLTGRDRYEDQEGNLFVMTSRFRGLRNGTPYRYSWLE